MKEDLVFLGGLSLICSESNYKNLEGGSARIESSIFYGYLLYALLSTKSVSAIDAQNFAKRSNLFRSFIEIDLRVDLSRYLRAHHSMGDLKRRRY